MSCSKKKTFLYFAYGSNLLSQRIHVRNKSALRKTIGKLLGYRLDFNRYSSRWGGCAATIVPDRNRYVWGAVWEIDISCLSDLDKQEGVHKKIYKPLKATIITPQNETLECRTYQLLDLPDPYLSPGTLPEDRRPSRIYLETILQGAVESKLPEDYLQFLKSFAHNGYSGPVHIPGMELNTQRFSLKCFGKKVNF